MTAGAVSAPLIIPIIHLQTHRAKNHINTSTPVSLHSDTPGVQIFYTLDGSRPAVQVHCGSSGSSRKYRAPLLLPAGRVSIRAVAVTSDGRQSSTVTKLFFVEFVDSDSSKRTDDNFLQSDRQRPPGGTPAATKPSVRPAEPQRDRGESSPQSGPRFLSSRLGRPSSRCFQRSRSASPGVLKQLDSTQTSRILKETDFLRCVGCLGLRPSDPLARFCPACGAALPGIPEHRAPPAEGGQMVSCVFCNSSVPVNTHTCFTCEAPIQQQLHPQASRTLQDHVLCGCCGSGNPAHISTCLTCESQLQPTVCVGPPPIRKLFCSRCKRMNHSEARFCDCCGAKAAHAAGCVICWRCGASGHPHAAHCAACGAFLDSQAPPTSCCDITAGGVANNQASTLTSHDATWQETPSNPKHLQPSTAEQHTQTVGLYFPSATALQQRTHLSRQQVNTESRPPLTAISPGRGFWRRQLDHVCAHLRSYAQNNAPFRALLGEPRLGQVVSAVMEEDGREVSITISFVSAGREETQVSPAGCVGPAEGLMETLSDAMQRTSISLRSDTSTGGMTPAKPKPTPKPAVKDVLLLQELAKGRGDIGVLQQILDQGADPSCCDADGRHALAVAVVNRHHDVLPVLVQRGADVNQQSGPMKNSALHEAVFLGSEGLRCVQVLLSCGAGAGRRNAGGLTPFDVAVKIGSDEAAAILAAHAGRNLLGKLGKPKLNHKAV